MGTREYLIKEAVKRPAVPIPLPPFPKMPPAHVLLQSGLKNKLPLLRRLVGR